jgi:hypothetical protein
VNHAKIGEQGIGLGLRQLAQGVIRRQGKCVGVHLKNKRVARESNLSFKLSPVKKLNNHVPVNVANRCIQLCCKLNQYPFQARKRAENVAVHLLLGAGFGGEDFNDTIRRILFHALIGQTAYLLIQGTYWSQINEQNGTALTNKAQTACVLGFDPDRVQRDGSVGTRKGHALG